MIKVLHYLNQFFAGIGGEEKAGQEVLFLSQPVGIGSVLENAFKAHGVEYATIACGDNYFHEAEENALGAMGAAIDQFHPDIFLAGPAFNAGRYGIACAKVCSGAFLRSPPCTKTTRARGKSAATFLFFKPAPQRRRCKRP